MNIIKVASATFFIAQTLMKPTHTKFLSRYEAELLSKVSIAARSGEVVFGAERFVHASKLEPSTIALISINSPDSNDPKELHLRAGDDGLPQVSGFWNPLMLMFHDIDPSGCGDEFLQNYILFDDDMASRVLDYLIKMEQTENVRACWSHCQAGISRSAGVAKFIADIYKLWYPETYRLYNKHVYSTLRSVYNSRILTNKPTPGILHL